MIAENWSKTGIKMAERIEFFLTVEPVGKVNVKGMLVKYMVLRLKW